MDDTQYFINGGRVNSLATFQERIVAPSASGSMFFTQWEGGFIRTLCASLLALPDEGPVVQTDIRVFSPRMRNLAMFESICLCVTYRRRRLSFTIQTLERTALTIAAEVYALCDSPVHAGVRFAGDSETHHTYVLRIMFHMPRLVMASISGAMFGNVMPAELPILRQLEVSATVMSNVGWQAVCQIVEQSPLVILMMKWVQLDDAKVSLLAASMRRNTVMRKLQLEDCAIGDAGVIDLMRAAVHLQQPELIFHSDRITDAGVLKIANDLDLRTNACILQLHSSAITDAGLACLLGAALRNCNMIKLCVSCEAGPRSIPRIQRLARSNLGRLMYLECGTNDLVAKSLHILPDLMHSTFFSLNLALPTHAVGMHYLALATKGARWRDVFHIKFPEDVRDGSEASPSMFFAKTPVTELMNNPRPCVITHGVPIQELNSALAQRASIQPELHSLAIAHTDLSRGLPPLGTLLPTLQRLALMNCCIQA